MILKFKDGGIFAVKSPPIGKSRPPDYDSMGYVSSFFSHDDWMATTRRKKLANYKDGNLLIVSYNSGPRSSNLGNHAHYVPTAAASGDASYPLSGPSSLDHDQLRFQGKIKTI